MAAELDAKVAEFRDRPLDAGPYRYLWIDALTQKVREGGRVVNVSAVIATAVNAEGRREIVGFDIVTTEDTAAWTGVPAVAGGPGPGRGRAGHLRRPRRHQSGDRRGAGRRVAGSGAEPISWPTWPRKVPKASWPMIATLVRSIFEQPDRDATWAQLGDVVDKLTQAGFGDAAVDVARRRRRHLGVQRVPGRALAQDPVATTPRNG